MAISFVGQTRIPAVDDANSNTGPTLTLTPPGNMQAGDLVVVAVGYRGAVTITNSVTGDQTWTSSANTQNTGTFRLFWCVFNGTWAANPQFTVGAGTAGMMAHMVVQRGVDTASPWDVMPVLATQAASLTYVLATFDTLTAGAVACVGAYSVDDNSWTVNNSFMAPSGAGNIFWRSASGTDQSIAWACKMMAAPGAVGQTTLTQSALGSDAGVKWYGAMKPATSTTYSGSFTADAFIKQTRVYGGGGGPETTALDTFADTNGTPLVSHTPDAGGPWTHVWDDGHGQNRVSGGQAVSYPLNGYSEEDGDGMGWAVSEDSIGLLSDGWVDFNHTSGSANIHVRKSPTQPTLWAYMVQGGYLYRMSSGGYIQISNFGGSGGWYRFYVSGSSPTSLKVERRNTQGELGTGWLVETTDNVAGNQMAEGLVTVSLTGSYDYWGLGELPAAALDYLSVSATGATGDGPGLTADAYISAAASGGTVEGSFTADAFVKATLAGSLTADAFVKRTENGTVSADAFIRKESAGSFTSDAYICRLFSGAFAADAFIKTTLATGVTADAFVKRTFDASLTADAYVCKVSAASFTADAFLKRCYLSTIEASAFVKTTSAGAFTADAHIAPPGASTVPGSFTASAHIRNTLSAAVTVDAFIGRSTAGTLTADAYVRRTSAGAFTAASYIKVTRAGSFTANAFMLAVLQGAFTADAYIRRVFAAGFTADAYVQAEAVAAFSADAYIVNPFAATDIRGTQRVSQSLGATGTVRLSLVAVESVAAAIATAQSVTPPVGTRQVVTLAADGTTESS